MRNLRGRCGSMLLVLVGSSTAVMADPSREIEDIQTIMGQVSDDGIDPDNFQRLVVMGPSATANLFAIFEDTAQSFPRRWVAARAIGTIGDRRWVQALSSRLTDSDAMVRYAVTVVLGDLGGPEAFQALRNAIDDPAMVVRTAAVEALPKAGGRAAIPLLLAELDHPRNSMRGQSMWIRRRIIRELGQLHATAAIPQLVDSLDDGLEDHRREAVGSLEQITGRKVSAETLDATIQDWKSWWALERQQPSKDGA